MSSPLAVGVDGCPAGWVAAFSYGTDDPPTERVQRTELRLYRTGEGGLARLVDDCEALTEQPVLAVDVPMGLPPRAGLRECDRIARKMLGRRWRCVFPAPDRKLLGLTFEAARQVVLDRRAAEPAVSQPVMTKQAMAIALKIAEADLLLTAKPERQRWLVEVHPEVSFLILARTLGHPIPPAGLPPKKRGAGRVLRAHLLARVFPDSSAQVAAMTWGRADVGVDDALDAYAGLWSALRYRAAAGVPGDGLLILGDNHLNGDGLLAQMIA